jgi:hypothetical protein
MKKSKKQKQSETIIFDYENFSDSEKAKFLRLVELVQRLKKTIDREKEYIMPSFSDGRNFINELSLKSTKKDLKYIFRFIYSSDDRIFSYLETLTPSLLLLHIQLSQKYLSFRKEEMVNILGMLYQWLYTLLFLKYSKYKKITMTDMESLDYDLAEYFVIARSFEALGYWKYKKEEIIRNKTNWEKQTKKSEKNKEAIREVLEEMNITTSLLLAFKGDTMKRDNFDKKAKEATGLSPKRIRDIARDILKDHDNKPTRH